MSSMYRAWAKRVLDFVGGLFLLFAFVPVLALVALTVVVVLGRPVLFRQSRLGLNGTDFEILKFRTMAQPTQAGTSEDEQRIGRFGRALRASHLDELPQLINVVRGDMSMVGPRPLLTHYWTLFSDQQRRRQSTRPGLTGLAQVSGNNSLSWEEKLDLDVRYVERISFLLDLRILGRTIPTVLLGRGVRQSGYASAEPFKGSSSK